ncbi:chemotaxis protein [Cellvibrio mixtus]|jgi:methyl-accepting chemotaxis protein|uniref:Chemotaxis protein n=1 Tax=Cellvibrio mixtus TaxID=39650 RepID=A0A266QCW0_9GAMM|nr:MULTISPECIES: methyl-accepting chemotaxis protein [Cellvibrio]AQT60869.1 chemotaxis protein [Cellvibrio sp. PSBB023]OZY87189.1 chemotaxis protein [Cellvibrio mixtus]
MLSFSSIQGRLLFAVGAGIILFVMISGIAISLLSNTITDYNRLIAGSVAQERSINHMNFQFKTQVQEWKNVLLRGKDPQKLTQYWTQFETLHRDIQQQGARLKADLQGESRAKVEAFLAAHETAFGRYQIGLQDFKNAGFDPAAGDKAVAGIDREPSKLLEESAQFISAQVASDTATNVDASKSVSFWASALILLGGILVAFLVLVILRKSLISPLANINNHLAVLASGNFRQSLQFSDGGELGSLAKNIKQVQHSIVQVVTTVQNSMQKLADASNQITQSASAVARYTDQAHHSTDQVSAAITEMTATVQEVASNAGGAADAAQHADHNAQQGLSIMGGTLDAINQLSQETNKAGNAMAQLEEDTNRIGSVLVVIKNVAEQTNLLALNAAIEAARAGEQGRGFAVVADEVRSLAKRTQDSTAEIQQIIEAVQKGALHAVTAMKSSQSKTAATLEMAGRAGQSITQITQAITAILGMNMQIATAAEEQSYTAEEINKNIIRLVNLIESLNQDARMSEQIALRLDDTTKDLENQIAHFAV